MNIHRKIDASINLIEVPAHVGLNMTPAALRVWLDVPAELMLTQWQLAPLHMISAQLTGCTWQVVGCLVSATDQEPAYPYLQYSDPPVRLQARLWRISKPPRQLHGDLYWHPSRGRRFKIDGPGETSDDALLQVWSWLYATDAHSRGRPSEAAYVVDRAALERRLIETILRLEKYGQPATRARVAEALSWSRGTLGNYCNRFHVDFDTVRQRIRGGQSPQGERSNFL